MNTRGFNPFVGNLLEKMLSGDRLLSKNVTDANGAVHDEEGKFTGGGAGGKLADMIERSRSLSKITMADVDAYMDELGKLKATEIADALRKAGYKVWASDGKKANLDRIRGLLTATMRTASENEV